jgi:hypothetical protein
MTTKREVCQHPLEPVLEKYRIFHRAGAQPDFLTLTLNSDTTKIMLVGTYPPGSLVLSRRLDSGARQK